MAMKTKAPARKRKVQAEKKAPVGKRKAQVEKKKAPGRKPKARAPKKIKPKRTKRKAANRTAGSRLRRRRRTEPKCKAIIFTHCGVDPTDDDFDPDELKEEYTEIFADYIEAAQVAPISILYIYVDCAVRALWNDKRRFRIFKNELGIPADLLEREDILSYNLRQAERRARRLFNDGQALPKIQIVGLSQLVPVFVNLIAADPALSNYIAGPHKNFTYDSPKFVESIIRLARGRLPHLANDPIVRLDADVSPNADSIVSLLTKYDDINTEMPFYFFSGTYGLRSEKDDKALILEDRRVDDMINGHAVRTAWFFAPDVIPEDDPEERGKAISHSLIVAKYFLSDLSAFGAMQFKANEAQYTKTPRSFKARKSCQTISGAGLIMSPSAVSLLPPFMNFDVLTVWVDDHLKRVLHEKLEDIAFGDPERETDAEFRQERHKKITMKEESWARNVYFRRLLEGCIAQRLLITPQNHPTRYSELISEIVMFKTKEIPGSERKRLNSEMKKTAKEHCEAVLKCWSRPAYSGYASADWAEKVLAGGYTFRVDNKRETITITKVCDSVVGNLLNYADLVLEWPAFVRAIERLKFGPRNEWLFQPAR